MEINITIKDVESVDIPLHFNIDGVIVNKI